MVFLGEFSLTDAVDGPHALGVSITDGNDHASSDLELAEQGLWDVRRTARDDDSVKGGEHRFAFVSVAVIQRRFPTHRFEQRPCRVEEGFLPFDAVDFEAERTKHRTLITASSADFQDVVSWLSTEQFALLGDGVGLADGLACRNGKRFVAVGELRERRIQKVMPRHAVHRIQHTLVLNAHRPQLLKQLAPLPFVHVCVLRQLHEVQTTLPSDTKCA